MGGMGRSIKSQRRAASSIFSSRSHSKKGASKLRNLDFSERNAYIRGIVRGIFHDPGRGAAIAKVAFRHHLNYKHQTSIIIAVDGIYSGQLIYAGRRAKIAIGNILPLGMLPEGTLVCNLEQTVGDRGCLVRSSGNYAVIVAHNPENNISRIKMPSGLKKTINSRCRAVIGQISGSGRIEKPKLKAGVSFLHKLAKRKNWPRSRGVAMNPVDHPHGGGNHQHIGHSATVLRRAVPGQKVGLIAARRSGVKKGSCSTVVQG